MAIDKVFRYFQEFSGNSKNENPISIREWINNPYYCGEDGINLKDFWKQELINFFESGKNEWIIYGSLGSGKTTVASMAVVYELYRLSCYSNIPSVFGLLSTTEIYFIYFSVSLQQANRTGFGKIKRLIDSIDYFRQEFPRNTYVDSELQFDGIRIIYGSSQAHQIGLDLFGTLLDEGDFYKQGSKGVAEFSLAREIYTSTINRRKVRFSVDGKDCGFSILVSSPAYQTDFVESRMLQARTNGTAYISEVVGFEVMRHRYSSENFVVFTGMEDIEPQILETKEEVIDLLHVIGERNIDEDLTFNGLIDKYKDRLDICFVPVDLKELFEENLLKAIRDVLGRSVKAIGGFLTEKDVRAIIDPRLKHPFIQKVITLSTESNRDIHDYFREDIPLFFKELPRYVHIDQSIKTDRTGMACSLVIASSLNDEDPYTATEWMLGISPPLVGEIPILKCAEFIVFLRNIGYNIVYATMDSYQSRASLQYLNSEGIQAELFSVDRNDEAYVALRTQTLHKRHVMYDYSPYIKEISNIEWNRRRRKVDHRSGLSKDISDCVAATTYLAIKSFADFPGAYYEEDFNLLDTLENDFVEFEF